MQAVTYPIRIYQYASWRLEANFKDPAGVKLDLTAYSGRLQIRRSASNDEVLLELTTENNGIVLGDDLADFNVIVRMTDDQTAALPTYNREVEEWVYDLVLFETLDPDYTTIRLLEGYVEVSPSVTRSAT